MQFVSLRSKIAQKVLGYFFLNEEAIMYVNEMAKKLAIDKRNLVKKLKEFESAGILSKEKRGNQRVYFLNKGYPLFDELKKVVLKTVGIEMILRKELAKIEGLKFAYIFGSYAAGKLSAQSDIDLLVVGDFDSMELSRLIFDLEAKFNREINAIEMDEKEYEERKSKRDAFLLNIEQGKRIQLI